MTRSGGPSERPGTWLLLFFLGTLMSSCAGAASRNAVQLLESTPTDKQAKSDEDISQATARPRALLNDQQQKQTPVTLIPGTDTFVRKTPVTAVASVEKTGDVTLNFVDADVRDVLKAVLGDALGLNYSVDPSVQGKITLQTSTPITREAVLPTIEAALRLNGLALISSKGLYSVVPLSEAQRRSGVPRLADTGAVGYGLVIVQLKYVTVEDIQKVLGALAPEGGVVYTDPVRNILILSGTNEDVDTIIETISLFDVDYLKSVSFGIFAPRNTTAEVLANELQLVLGDAAGPMTGLIKVIPIPRLNVLLVAAKHKDLLEDVSAWINRLDVEGEGTTRRIYLYRVQNAKASDLASTLGRLLGAQMTEMPTPASMPVGSRSSLGGIGSGMQMASPGAISPSSSGASAGLDTGASGVAFSLDGFRVVADERNNQLMILATPREYRLIESALKDIDVAPDQVLIEATIAEVSLNDDLKFGVQWFVEKDKRNTFKLTDDPLGMIVSKFPGFSYSYLIPDVQLVLNALATRTNVKVISSPKIMVLDNQTATLQVGDEVPIATQSAVSVIDPDAPIVNTIQFRQTGVILEVTPRINKSGLVIMDVLQEVSDVTATTTSSLDSPTIQQRKFTSTVAVQSGDTVALGGLIRDNVSKEKSGIPLLKNIPALGAAFRSKNNTQRRTELLVFITPRIVRGVDEAREVTDYLRGKLKRADFESKRKR